MVLFASALHWPAHAQAPKDEAAYYTDACYHPETGDLLGDRLALVKSSDGYVVRFQSAEGELGREMKGKAAVNDGMLSFDVDTADGKRLPFKGKVTPQEITGRFGNNRPSAIGKPDVHWRRVGINEFNIGPCKAGP